jgi:hypothetical protein
MARIVACPAAFMSRIENAEKTLENQQSQRID